VFVPSKKRPICKHCEKKATEQKLFDKDLKVEPCPKCGNDGIKFFNCGYSSFNPAGGECADCGYKVSQYADWNIKTSALVKLWNKSVRDYIANPEEKLKERLRAQKNKLRRLRRQLRSHDIDPVC
jgi:ribosomal protein L37E